MTEQQGRKFRILVADDDQDARQLVYLGLEASGYEMCAGQNGAEAVALTKTFNPDLIILDMMMPELTGSEACRRIKSESGGEHIPVLILTALGKVDVKMEAFNCGADDYLIKPFHFDELRARVRAFLRVRELNLSLREKNEELRRAQNLLVEQERKIVVSQLAGTAAHQLGQPLSAIILNCHLLERLPSSDERFVQALNSIKQDAQRMAEMIEKLRMADPKRTEKYYGGERIIGIDSAEPKKS